MIFYEQTQLHDPENNIVGDCFRCCLATLMQMPVAYVPQFQNRPNWKYGSWPEDVITWLELYGKEMQYSPVKQTGFLPPQGYSIASGKTKRFGGEILHSTIAYSGRVVFDPHPSKAGLVSIKDYLIIVDIDQ